MSEKFTAVEIPETSGYGIWGHQDYEKAISLTRQHFERQLEEAQRALAAIRRGDVRVFHQRGVQVATDRREVKP